MTSPEWPSPKYTCDTCDSEIGYFGYRCSNCRRHWCLTCKGSIMYTCAGQNHHFSEECCKECVPEYGRLGFFTYFCPRCAPPIETLEYDFKRAVYKFQEEITEQHGSSSCLPVGYLNNPENWTRDLKELESEWTEMMTRRW